MQARLLAIVNAYRQVHYNGEQRIHYQNDEMKQVWKTLSEVILAVSLLMGCTARVAERTSASPLVEEIPLPTPTLKGMMSLEETLALRHSVRSFTGDPLTLVEIGQLLWAAQGITRDWGGRTAPSAGALYPLEVYVATADGLYHYMPQGHKVRIESTADLREALWAAGLKQDAIRQAPAVFVITAVYARTESKYGARAERYVELEAGHAAQNLLLQAVALGLGGVPIGAFHDDQVQSVLSLPADHTPLYLIPVGHPQE